MMISSSRRRYTHTGELLTIIIITQMILNDAVSEQHTHTHTHTHTHSRNTLGAESCVYSLFRALSVTPGALWIWIWIWIWAPNEHSVSMETSSLKALSGSEREKRSRARASVFTDTRPGPRVAKQQSMRERADRTEVDLQISEILDSWCRNTANNNKHIRYDHELSLWGKSIMREHYNN